MGRATVCRSYTALPMTWPTIEPLPSLLKIDCENDAPRRELFRLDFPAGLPAEDPEEVLPRSCAGSCGWLLSDAG